MSLVGNLEDLGLGDILQIVSLSRKSGVLLLQSQNREGKIVFLNGQVIRATSSVFRENLGDLLIRRGIVDIETIKSALQAQRATSPPPRIGTILVEQFGVDRQTIDAIVREQIEKIAYSFFAWGEGTFSFELGESEELAATSFNPLQFMLDQGLNPQWLAMEGSRIVDEKRHRGESLEEEGGEPLIEVAALLGTTTANEVLPAPATAPVVAGDGGGRTVLLVDDDEVTRTTLCQVLTAGGFVVETAATAGEFLVMLEDCTLNGVEPLLLVDLILPRIDGGGVLGGLELVERLRNDYPRLSILVMSEHPNEEAERRVVAMRLPAILAKPTKTEVRESRGEEQLERLVERLQQVAQQGKEPAGREGAGPSFNLGAELRREFGEKVDPNRNNKGPESPGLFLLRGMLQELNNPSLGGGIILLVLRFASELMNRAVILLVKEDEIVGLGQFGIEAVDGELPDVRVRRMRIPRNVGSVLDGGLELGAPVKMKPGNSEWDHYLAEQLGGQPEEIFLGPIVSERKVVALLYGDNLPEKKPIGDTESLEIFLSQAGLAMEKALLERRLRGRDSAA